MQWGCIQHAWSIEHRNHNAVLHTVEVNSSRIRDSNMMVIRWSFLYLKIPLQPIDYCVCSICVLRWYQGNGYISVSANLELNILFDRSKSFISQSFHLYESQMFTFISWGYKSGLGIVKIYYRYVSLNTGYLKYKTY
jgi:hypothetical protein